jgi:hypothetical protein
MNRRRAEVSGDISPGYRRIGSGKGGLPRVAKEGVNVKSASPC